MPNDPLRVLPIDPNGVPNMPLHKDTAGMFVQMYETMLSKHGPSIANEFMHGFMRGLTHGLMYKEHYPKISTRRDPITKLLHITVVGTDGVITHDTVSPNEVPTRDSHEIDRHGR